MRIGRVFLDANRTRSDSLTPSTKTNARWIPPGTSIGVNGFNIPGGMVYVGSFMPADPGGWGSKTVAPCLVNPALKIASGAVGDIQDLSYWPSYSELNQKQRRAYLAWLSTGKSDTRYPVGYAFLYLYGLERRLLIDNPSLEEEALLVAEVLRLKAVYASEGSFPWVGGRAQMALILALTKAGIPAHSSGIAVTLASDLRPALMEALKELAESPAPDAVELAHLVPDMLRAKYDCYLGEELLALDYASERIEADRVPGIATDLVSRMLA